MKRHNHLGDVLEAFRFLREYSLLKDAGARGRVAEFLGFKWQEESTRRAPSKTWAGRASPAPPIALRDEVEKIPHPTGDENDAWVEQKTSASAEAPEWYSRVQALPRTKSAANLPELPLIPLLNPAWTRAILIAALAREVRDGDVDLDRLATKLASGQEVRRLPRLPRERLDKGVQVLVDVREAMRPFALDQQQILAEISALLPQELVEVISYHGCPSPVVSTQASEPVYRLPHAGSVVLLLTDLGSGPRLPGMTISHAGDWQKFAHKLRRAGCLVTALTPYVLRSLPVRLRREIAVFPWCRQTTSSRVGRTRKQVERRIRG